MSLGFWTDTADNFINGFSTFLLASIAFLSVGGSWAKSAIPLAAGLGLRFIGNIYYTITADNYEYGSPADWLWLFGSTVIYLFLARQGSADADD